MVGVFWYSCERSSLFNSLKPDAESHVGDKEKTENPEQDPEDPPSPPDQKDEIYHADLTVNYGNDLIHNGATITFSSPVDGVTFFVGTHTDLKAAAPLSWSAGTTYTFSATGTIKVFGKITKGGMDDVVIAQIYNVVSDYPDAAGQTGSQAIHMDSPLYKSWANGHANYVTGSDCDTTWQTPDKAYGKAIGDSYDIVCLGNGGKITLTFPKGIKDGDGYDFAVFENSFSDTFLELAFVEVSSNGVDFVRFDKVSLTADPVGAFGAVDPKKIYGIASAYRQGYGTPFNLSWLKHKKEVVNGTVNINNIRYVRFIDIWGNPASGTTDNDSFGNIIYDPYKCTGSGGFDLDAVGVINEAD